jgi:predicted dehydrogenase
MGLYDKNPKRAKDIGERIDAKVFPDFQSLLDAVDALAIVVTTISHYELAKQALQQGRHVFIEKPITEHLWQAEELCELAEQKGLKIQVGHIERFNPTIMEIEKDIKDPIFAECHRIHDIDLFLAFIPSKVKRISASGAGVLTKSIDIANARIEFENGAVCNVTASRISMKRSRKLRIFQKDAYFSIDFQNKTATHISKSKQLYKVMPKILMGKYDDIDPAQVVDTREVNASHRTKDALTTELESFVHAVEAGHNPVVDGRAGARALKIALEIVKEIEKNKVV